MLEVCSLDQATSVLRHAREIRRGQPRAVIVLSMVGKNYRLTRDMKEAAAALKLHRAKTPISSRQMYADAPGQGTVVWRMGARASAAATEIRQLFRELLSEAKHSRQPAKAGRRVPEAAD
jgi:chromosome partitioning protein